MTKLGSRQLGILKALDDHGEWSIRKHGSSLGPGWVWDTPSGTENTLETLVKCINSRRRTHTGEG